MFAEECVHCLKSARQKWLPMGYAIANEPCIRCGDPAV